MEKVLTYEAYFIKEKDGSFSVYFPDVHGCCSNGKTLAEAITMATEALSLALFDSSQKSGLTKNLPKSNNHSKIDLGNFCAKMLEYQTPEGSIIVPISFEPEDYYKKHYFNVIKKTVTIPKWLNDTAVDEDINFSQVLKEALIKKLDEIYKSGNRKIDRED